MSNHGGITADERERILDTLRHTRAGMSVIGELFGRSGRTIERIATANGISMTGRRK